MQQERDPAPATDRRFRTQRMREWEDGGERRTPGSGASQAALPWPRAASAGQIPWRAHDAGVLPGSEPRWPVGMLLRVAVAAERDQGSTFGRDLVPRHETGP